MTQEPNQGTTPSDETTRVTPPDASAPETPAAPPPTFEPADEGPIVRSQPVTSESGTFGAEAPAGRRASGVRWAIALGGVALVVAATFAIIALASGRPATSIAVGYMPAETIQYTEVRLDLPGDQRQKLAAFLANFPGFADQASVDTKLDEILDRLLSAASNGEQTWSADIRPWFGGVIATGSGPLSTEGLSGMPMSGMAGAPFVVVTIKDPAVATAWVQEMIGASASSSQYGDATLISGGNAAAGFVIGINSEVMLAGTDAAVRAAIDSKGDGKLAEDAEFKAAFETVGSDYVGFSFMEYRAYLESILNMSTGSGSGLDRTTVDDELLAMVPPWQVSVARIEADAIVGESVYPSIDFGFKAGNKRSDLAGHVPPGTMFYAESHDIGASLTALLDRLRQMPDLKDTFGQIDQGAGMIGGLNGLIGWWGDVGVAVTKLPDGTVGGGLLIAPTDAAKANETFTTLRSFLVLGGGQAGLQLRDVQHGDATVTVIDFSEAAGSSVDLPPGYKPEIAYAVTNDIVVIGYGQAWVEAVLDAGPGPSLADDARYKELLKRVGEENLGVTFVDVTAVRGLLEPLVRAELPADQWATYEREIVPYIVHLDAVVSSSRKDGDLDRLRQALTVK
jgi:hypothetical protein